MTKNNKTVCNHTLPPVEEIHALIKKAENVLVISHVDPDGDALGTQLAVAAYLKEIGKNVVILRDGEIPNKYLFLENITSIILATEYKPDISFDTVIVLECPDLFRTGSAAEFISDNMRIINIDHHRDNECFGELNWLNIEASSVGEMMFEYFEKVNYKINKTVADYLFVAIMTDTGRFRYRSTSPRTLEIAAQLIRAGADPQRNCDLVYYNMKPSTMILTGKVLNDIEFYSNGKICFLTLTNEMLNSSEADRTEADGLVDFTLFSNGVIIGALFKEINKDATKVSLRSKDSINVADIAARYNGGGHYNAAGFTINKPVADAKEELIKIFNEVLGE